MNEASIFNVPDDCATLKKNYLGRRLLIESPKKTTNNDLNECSNLDDISSTEISSKLLLDDEQESNFNQHLVADAKSLGNNSFCSNFSVSESYLQVFSDYADHLPASTNNLFTSNDNLADPKPCIDQSYSFVHKSESASAAFLVPPEVNIVYNSNTDINKTREQHNNIDEQDNISIGSDTLSGVSEDFSCSLSVNPVFDQENKFNQPLHDLKSNTNFSAENDNISRYNQENSVIIKNNDKPDCSTEKENVKIPEDVDVIDDDICVSEMSISSVTLPSYSWTRVDESSVASMDIEDLIRNSKRLLQNVTETLQQSKNQSVPCLTGSGNDNSISVDQSDLPFDSVSTEPVLSTEHKNTSPCMFQNIANDKFSSKYRGKDKDLDVIKSDKKLFSSCNSVNENNNTDFKDSTNKSTTVEEFSSSIIDNNQKTNLGLFKDQYSMSNNKKTIEYSSGLDIPDIHNHLIPSSGYLIKPKSYTELPSQEDDLNNEYVNMCQRSLPDLLSSVHISNNSLLNQKCQNLKLNMESDKKICELTSKDDNVESVEQEKNGSLASLLSKYSAAKNQLTRPLLPEGLVKVWLSQVISAISALHCLGIIWG